MEAGPFSIQKKKKNHSKFGSNSLALSAELCINRFQRETEAGGDWGVGGVSWQDERRLAAAAGRFSPGQVWPAEQLAFLKASKSSFTHPGCADEERNHQRSSQVVERMTLQLMRPCAEKSWMHTWI